MGFFGFGSYDADEGFHYNSDENWGFYDGDCGPDSDFSGRDQDCSEPDFDDIDFYDCD